MGNGHYRKPYILKVDFFIIDPSNNETFISAPFGLPLLRKGSHVIWEMNVFAF